jgi:hypothetical protein
MSKLAIRLSILAIGATALVAVPVVTPAKAEARSRHAHVQKHKKHRSVAGPLFVGEAQPAVRPSYYPNDQICPGIGKSFECKIWPPPIDVDPDRKIGRP